MGYSFAQLEGIWIQNGGNKTAAPIAAAIAMAESGGDPNATNHNSNGSTDRGLWQINSIWGALSTFNVSGNAKAAIQISKNGTNWQPWVTFTTGAYRKFLSNVPPEAVTAADALSGTSTPQKVPVAAGVNPATLSIQPVGTGSPGEMGDVESILSGIPGVGWIVGTATGVADVGQALAEIGNVFTTGLHYFLLIFQPSFWLRIGSFFVGTLLLAFGAWMLVKAVNPDAHLPMPSIRPIPIPAPIP